MIILGVDPGTATTGYGIIRVDSKDIEVIKFSLIETDKNGSSPNRLHSIYLSMNEILEEFKPDVMAIEKIFFAANAKTAISVGQAQGVMFLAAAKNKVEVFEYAPGTIKKLIAGDGRADKKLIQKSLRSILGRKVRSKARKKTHFDNAADALAVALCHAYKIQGG